MRAGLGGRLRERTGGQAIIAAIPITTATLRPKLVTCGYAGALLRANFEFGTAAGARTASLAGFAHAPADVRSICLAAIDASEDSAHEVAKYRDLGAPLVFVCRREHLQLWKQSAGEPQLHLEIPAQRVDAWFQTEGHKFSPEAIYRAKTQGRFEPRAQLDFVDVGLLPVVEAELGGRLSELVEGLIGGVKAQLGGAMTPTRGEWMLREVFWLLAAKILHDKAVPNFRRLDLADVEDARERVARHYGASQPVQRLLRQEREALLPVGARLARFASLAQVTTESLAFVYENALISRETRTRLGTHSTPNAVVEYVVGRLSPYIQQLPSERRHVFEPACGHAAFLVAAMRLLRDLLPPSVPEEQRRYLRHHLVGLEVDAFAVEIARLSLTLADIPNPNGWRLHSGDMFAAGALERLARGATVLLSNPPYEDFTADQRRRYRAEGTPVARPNKTFEMLHRVLPQLPHGALIGLVLQQNFLQNSQARDLRELLVSEFELLELCLLPDNIFALSDQETVLVLGRRGRASRAEQPRVAYKRVREAEARRFQQTSEVSTSREVPQERFAGTAGFDLRVPDLEELWTHGRLRPVETFAHVGQGLTFRGAGDLPVGRQAMAEDPFPGGVPGFARFPRGGVALHRLPPTSFFNLEKRQVARERSGATLGVPQVLLPYAPVSRDPWRLTALLDPKGHAVTSRFLVVRPLRGDLPLEFFWALFNSPYANAYVYTHADKRSILAGTVRRMPVPEPNAVGVERVTAAARAYLDLAGRPGAAAAASELQERLLRVDAEVLRLYELPPRQERTLLQLFSGYQRPGVPFPFDRYYPADLDSAVPLHLYLSEEYRRAKPGRLLGLENQPPPSGLLEALKRSTIDFGE